MKQGLEQQEEIVRKRMMVSLGHVELEETKDLRKHLKGVCACLRLKTVKTCGG